MKAFFVPKVSYEFSPDIPVGTKVVFLKTLDPMCRAYDPDIVEIVATIDEVQPRRLYVSYTDARGHVSGACLDVPSFTSGHVSFCEIESKK